MPTNQPHRHTYNIHIHNVKCESFISLGGKKSGNLDFIQKLIDLKKFQTLRRIGKKRDLQDKKNLGNEKF